VCRGEKVGVKRGQNSDEHARIGFRDGALGRRAILAGTRLDIWQVIETVRNSDNSVEEAAAYLDLNPSRVQAAVDYYTACRDEVDEIAERERVVAERAEQCYTAIPH
jgi:uncharacterized protein (DUF433 family)